jgi:hypothetical protein
MTKWQSSLVNRAAFRQTEQCSTHSLAGSWRREHSPLFERAKVWISARRPSPTRRRDMSDPMPPGEPMPKPDEPEE